MRPEDCLNQAYLKGRQRLPSRRAVARSSPSVFLFQSTRPEKLSAKTPADQRDEGGTFAKMDQLIGFIKQHKYQIKKYGKKVSSRGKEKYIRGHVRASSCITF